MESVKWGKTRDGETIGFNERIATSMSMGRIWTILSRRRTFLKWHGARQKDLITFVGPGEEVARQQAGEESGYRTPTWTVLKKLQVLNGAKRIDRGKAIMLPHFFNNTMRGGTKL